MRTRSLLSLFLLGSALSFADVPTWTVVDTGLDDTFGNAGKGLFDPQVAGFTGVAFGAGKFVAVGNSSNETVIRWATSPDGTTWTPHSQTIANGGTSYGQSKVHFLDNQFIFFATHSVGGFAQTFVYVSADGLTWTAHKLADGSHSVVEFDASSAAVVAAGTNGDQYISSDLTTWSPSPVVTDGGLYSHNDVAYGAGHFISTINGFGGQTYASENGTSWTPLDGQAVPGGGYVASGNGVLLLAFNSDYRRSTDGGTFSAITPTIPSGWILGGSPSFAGGRFLALSFCLSPFKSAYLASTDGLTWTDFGTPPVAPTAPAGQSRSYFSADVAYGNGTYVFVGTDIAQTLFTKTVLPLVFIATAPAADGDSGDGDSGSTDAPESQAVAAGSPASLSFTASGSIQWQRNGSVLTGETAGTLSLPSVQPADVGLYSAVITNGDTTTVQTAIVGVTSSVKVLGDGREVNSDVPHPNHNIYDQVLLSGTAASITADPTQMTRMSYIDLNDDIVQVEFSGPGTVSLVLDGASGPAAPAKYNQDVVYMKGHAGIVVTGATKDSHLSVFSVGKANAVNQTLFKDGVAYDGVADIAFIAIMSVDGKFGGLRTADASYWATRGLTGVYAPGVHFTGPVYVGNIDAHETATPVLILGGADDLTLVTGGSLEQDNHAAVQVSGLTKLEFRDGTTSGGTLLPAQSNLGHLEQDGVDVTDLIVDAPAPPVADTGATIELTYFASGSNPPYTNGAKKTFIVSTTSLKFDSTTLTNPQAESLNAPFTGYLFTDADTGLVWEVIFNADAFHEINISRNGSFVGQWSE